MVERFPNDQSMAAGAIPVWIAAGSTDNPDADPPATIAASQTWTSDAIPSGGARGIAAGATLNKAGTLEIQRYIDAAGTIAIGAAITQAMTSGVAATIAVNDGLPCASFRVIVVNGEASLATLTGVAVVRSF